MSIRPYRPHAAPALAGLALMALMALLFLPACSESGTGAVEAPAGGSEPAAAPVAAAVAEPGAPAAAPVAGVAPTSVPAAQAAEAPLPVEQIPAVVARLDGRDITREDLLARAGEARGALADRGIQAPPPTRSFYRRVLDDLVGNALLYAELNAQGKAATPAEVDQQLAAVRGQFKTEAEFDQALAARGFDRERLKRELSESLTVQKWVRETVVPSITVTEAEAREFYAQNQARMIEPERVRARHVLVSVDPKATPDQKAEKRKRADELRARIAGGTDFAQVAKEASDDPNSAPRGGDLNWLARGQAPPAFEEAAFALEPGKLSDVIESRFGFHILEVQEKKAESPVAFEQAREQIEQVLKQRKLETSVREKLNQLGSKAKVEILI